MNAWKSVTELDADCFSTAESIYRMLIWLPEVGWREGWYFGGLINEWRQSGSNSQVFPTHFMEIGNP